MKWRDERTENRREVDYVIREAGEDLAVCLLADCPLRIAGTPDLISIALTGQTIIRADTEWERATTIWEGGETDDEGLVRICSTDCFHSRGDELRQDLIRMIREYRQGVRECHGLLSSPPTTSGLGSADVGRIEKRIEILSAVVQQSRTDAPIPVTAETLRREIEPMLDTMKTYGKKTVQAVTKQTEQTITDLAPHFRDDRRMALLALLKSSNNLSDIERKAATLSVEGLTGPEIALRLPNKKGKPVSREAVRQILQRVERKTGSRRLFKRGSYADNENIAAQARRIAAQRALEQAADAESET
jgi:hypothetical protein